MPINKETERAALLLLGVALLSKLADIFKQGAALLEEGNTALQQGGAQLYEMVHPEEKGHANDLPLNPGIEKPVVAKRLPPEAVLMIAQMVGFPDPKLAAAIAMAESNGRTAIVNSTTREQSVGLWQINMKAHRSYTLEQLIDPMQNAQAAFKISKGGTNWKPWGAYTDGRYMQWFGKGIFA